MNSRDQTSVLVSDALEFSDIFVKLHSSSSTNAEISVKSEDMKVILPYLFFNPNQFSNLKSQNIHKSSYISFRLSYMQELFETPEDPDPTQTPLPISFEECQNPAQKMCFLQRDLMLIELNDNNHPPLFLNLLQYAQYISDCLPILYARFSSRFRVATFISVAFAIGDNAIKSFCFCFPNVLSVVFKTALERNSHSSLLAYLAAMSPNHRPLLHPKLSRFPIIFSMLAVKFFPENSPLIISAAIDGCYPEIKNDLMTISKMNHLSPTFYKCYARCCSALGMIDDSDYDILKLCKDEKLIVATLFNIETSHSKYFPDFLRTFSQNPSTMAFLLELVCDSIDHNENELLQKIKSVLGEDYEWQIQSSFKNHVLQNFSMLELKSSWFGNDSKALYILSTLIDEIINANTISWMPGIISTLTEVNAQTVNSLNKIIDSFVKVYPIDKSMEFKNIIDKILKSASESTDLLIPKEIAKNPSPAIAATIILLHAEELCFKKNWFKQINTFPLRFIVCCASQFEKCSSIFYYLCSLCNRCAGHVFCQSPLMTQTPEYLLSKGDPYKFLTVLSANIQNAEEELFNVWMVHRFVSPFQYIIDTVDAIGGPSEIIQLHQVFNFPKESLHNKFILRIISLCIIDIVSLYEKKYPPTDKTSNPSVVLILYSAFDLLKDSLVDKKTVCDFLNDLFYLSPWVLDSFLVQGCQSDLISTITHGIKVLETSWSALRAIIKSPGIKTRTRLFILEFASHLAGTNNNLEANKGCQSIMTTLMSSIKVTDENIGLVLDSVVRIYKVFPDLFPIVEKLLQTIKDQVTSRTTKIQMQSMIDLAFDEVTSYVFSSKE
ncbi:hypothetical protein TRFO_41537 [Tritrichomonas foetus]|uniref:Uncharacterized protein n=1 Tax=Tritrichomonas foetus TaxID=1144522 RepID=A0A1J4L008_9EUKA|nr:hypothetical protein TRFO_41537 [Tritrichomonas foetus]|eukprot:OHT16847.1 hypothetical protein TRFO_41537 [Tritrichomonas foetus]